VSRPENSRNILDEVLHLSGGFSESDRPRALDALSALVPHLSRWQPDEMLVDVSVKDRDGREQTVTLRAELSGYPQLLAKASNAHLDAALVDARREFVRQLEDEKKKRDPKSNRMLRKKTT
jgi:hypothetical protein